MIILGLLLQVLICTILLINEVFFKKCKNFATVFFLALYFLLFILEPLLLQLVFGGAKSIVRDMPLMFEDEMIYHALNVYGILILSTFSILSFVKFGNPPINKSVNISKVSVNSLGGLLIIGYFIFLYSTGMSLEELFVSSRFSWFNESSAFIVGIAISHYFFSLTPVYLFSYLSVKKSFFVHIIFITSIALVVVYGVVSQDRKWLFYLISGAIAYLYKKSGNKLVLKGKYFAIGGGLFFILLISQFLRNYLARFISGQVSTGFFEELVDWFSFLIEFGDISYFYRASAETIRQTFNEGIIEPLGVIRRNVLFFLPVGWSGGLKPEDLSAVFSDIVRGGDSVRRGNMPPGFFGLFVMSFGVSATAVIVCLIPFLVRKLDALFLSLRGGFSLVFLSSYLSFLLLLFRGDDSSAFYFLIFGVIVLSVVKYMTNVIGFVLRRQPTISR